jgi:hypothetical protein
MATPARQRILDAALNLIQNGGDRAGHTREIPWTPTPGRQDGGGCRAGAGAGSCMERGTGSCMERGKEPLWQSSRTRQRRE